MAARDSKCWSVVIFKVCNLIENILPLNSAYGMMNTVEVYFVIMIKIKL